MLRAKKLGLIELREREFHMIFKLLGYSIFSIITISVSAELAVAASSEKANKARATSSIANKIEPLNLQTTDLLENHKTGDWLPKLPVDPQRFREEMKLPKRSKAEMEDIDKELLTI